MFRFFRSDQTDAPQDGLIGTDGRDAPYSTITHLRRHKENPEWIGDNPEGSCNILSTLFFGWLSPMLWKARERHLMPSDVYRPLIDDRTSFRIDLFKKSWQSSFTEVRKLAGDVGYSGISRNNANSIQKSLTQISNKTTLLTPNRKSNPEIFEDHYHPLHDEEEAKTPRTRCEAGASHNSKQFKISTEKQSLLDSEEEIDNRTTMAARRLVFTILRLHTGGLLFSGFLRLLADLMLMVSPQILELLISWISEGPLTASKVVPQFLRDSYESLSLDWSMDTAYLIVGGILATGLFCSTMSVSLLQAQHNHSIYRVGVQCQAEMIAAVYSKALRVALPFANVGDGGENDVEESFASNPDVEITATPNPTVVAPTVNHTITPDGYSSVYDQSTTNNNDNINANEGDSTANDTNQSSGAPSQGVSVGQVVNLLSSDVERIYDFFTYIHVSWSSPLQITLATILLIRVLGFCAIPGIAVMGLAVPLTSVVAGALEVIQKGVVRAKDRRTRATHEFLSGVRVVKLYGWEDSFAAKVRQMRLEELGHLWEYYKAEVITWLIYLLLPVVVCVVSFVSLYFMEPTRLTPTVVFTSIALFALLKEPMQQLPYLIWTFVEGRNAARRLALFLSSSEIVDLRKEDSRRAKHDFPEDYGSDDDDDEDDNNHDVPGGIKGNYFGTSRPIGKRFGDHEDLGQSGSNLHLHHQQIQQYEPKTAPPALSTPMIEVRNLSVSWSAPLLSSPDFVNLPNTVDDQINGEKLKKASLTQLLHDSKSAITEGDNEDDGGETENNLTAPHTLQRRSFTIDGDDIMNLTGDFTNGSNNMNVGGISDSNPPLSALEGAVLSDLSFTVHSGELLVVLGRTGEGKSSLISALLGEMRVLRGSCKVRGTVAFAAQQAWIQQTSLRNNVLFGRPLDNASYLTVVEACALVQDFEDCPGGDVWVVADKGAGLSGGQKQRVALARAAYSDADVYLLDDVLSAVDAHVAKHIFERLILTHLRARGKAIVLVTNNLSLAAHADKIIYLDSSNENTNGAPQLFKSYKDFRASGVDLAALVKADEEAIEEAAAEEEAIEEAGDRMMDLDDFSETHEAAGSPDLQPRRKGMGDPALFRSSSSSHHHHHLVHSHMHQSGHLSGGDEPRFRRQSSHSNIRRRSSKENGRLTGQQQQSTISNSQQLAANSGGAGSGMVGSIGSNAAMNLLMTSNKNALSVTGSQHSGRSSTNMFFSQKQYCQNNHFAMVNSGVASSSHAHHHSSEKRHRRNSDEFFKRGRPGSAGAIVMAHNTAHNVNSQNILHHTVNQQMFASSHNQSSVNGLMLSGASITHSRKLDAVGKEAKKKLREARRKRREAAAAAVQKNAEDAQGALADRGSLDAFRFYFLRGWKPAFAFAIGCIIVTHFCNALGNFTLAKASDTSKENHISMSTGLMLYIGFCFTEGLATYGSLMLAYLGGWFASDQIHEDLLIAITESSMRFFDTHPLGRVLNRFTKDTHALDKEVIQALWAWTFELVRCTVTISVIIFATPIVLFGIIPLALLYGYTQRIYIPASRALRRLAAGLRSPLLADCSEMLEGAFTVRAFKMEDSFLSQFENKVDRALSAHWCSCTANRWLTVRLEFVGNCTVLLCGLVCVWNRDFLGPGLSGLVLTYALTVTESLAWLVRYGAECEAAMVSVDRLAEYTRTEEYRERLAPAPDAPVIPVNWPNGGMMSFTELKMRYGGNEGPFALNGFTLDIRAGEKVGVVGRTGAGKSSLLLSLLRIVEPCEGRVLLDGVDLSKLGVRELRRRVAIIPQEPVLFSGTLRDNIDPLYEYTDSEVCLAIIRAHLPAALSCQPVDDSVEYMLEYPVEENGSNLSAGQRQLVCMARALCRSLDFSSITVNEGDEIPISESTGQPAIRGSRVLLLDEATASLDPLTDQLMQDTIAKEFADCTVIAIAHRLSSLMDYDRVVVMQKGQVAETGHPKTLADDPTTTFAQMVAAERRLAAGEPDFEEIQQSQMNFKNVGQHITSGTTRRLQGVQELLRRAEWFAVTSTSMDSN